MNLKLWDIPAVDKEKTVELAKKCGVEPLLAALLRARGMDTPEKVSGFLGAGEFSDPFNMKDMDRASSRIRLAVDNFEHIAVYGDYDMDGLSSTSMLYTYLQDKGANVSYYIPRRDIEGYGMNMGAVDTLSKEGVDLIVTVDNGVAANKEIAYAKFLGMDVVVTDHHQPQGALPDAPLVNPHREDDDSGLTYLCGAGVVLKLLMALEGDIEAVAKRYIDLAALGTVGDSVELIGENRLIVSRGLESMEKRERPGLAALLGEDPVTSTKLSFGVIPCLNSPGRIGTPDSTVRLLTHQDRESARILAEDIQEENLARKEMMDRVIEAAQEALENRPELMYDRVLVVWGEGWHHGLVGLVAGRLSELYGKPAIVLSVIDGEARGSGRSIEGFDIFRAVTECGDLLIHHGGHPMAAGLTLSPENLEEFRRRINRYAREESPEMPFPVLGLDCTLQGRALALESCRAFAPMEPFGVGNPTPAFAVMGATLADIRGFGRGNHCELTCRSGSASFKCKLFKVRPEEIPYPLGSAVDLAVNLEENHYRGSVSLSVQVRDMRLSGLDRLECLRDYRTYEKFKRGEPLLPREAERLRPDRDRLAAVYTLLPRAKGSGLGLEELVLRLEKSGLNMGMLLFGLEVLKERGLIDYRVRGNMLEAWRLPVKGRADITLSPLFRELSGLAEKDGQEKE